jgi:hypothetical protein
MSDEGRDDRPVAIRRLTKLIRDLTPALKQARMSALAIAVDRVEQFPSTGKELAKPLDDDALEVPGRDTAGR